MHHHLGELHGSQCFHETVYFLLERCPFRALRHGQPALALRSDEAWGMGGGVESQSEQGH